MVPSHVSTARPVAEAITVFIGPFQQVQSHRTPPIPDTHPGEGTAPGLQRLAEGEVVTYLRKKALSHSLATD